MTSLPRTLNDAERAELLRFLRSPLVRRTLDSLLDLREQELRDGTARTVLDPEVHPEKIADIIIPCREEIARIQYVRAFLDLVEGASFPDSIGSPSGRPAVG